MTHLHSPVRWATLVGAVAVALALSGCGPLPASDKPTTPAAADTPAPAPESEPAVEDEPEEQPETVQSQEETCDWDSPKLTGAADAPASQEGELTDVLVGAWQHTHTDEGAGFEPVTNDHRYVFPAPERMLYCQHVPGATDHAENAANVVLNGTTIELPGGKYGYTVTAWDQDTMVWDNPVGGGYIYLLQRR